VVIIVGPYLCLRQLAALADDEPGSTSFPILRKKGGVDVYGKATSKSLGAIAEVVVTYETTPSDKSKSKSKSKSKYKSNTKPVAPVLKARSDQHIYHPNGLVEVNPEGQHPIYDLLDRSKDTWQKKLDGASKTLEQAVDEYRRRYHRAPPRGFDRWWKYVRKHDVQLPDEYDQIVSYFPVSLLSARND
jgi:hypothetical protein